MYTAKPESDKPRHQVCGDTPSAQLRPGALLRGPVAELIRSETGGFDPHEWIRADDPAGFRHRHIRELLAAERGELPRRH